MQLQPTSLSRLQVPGTVGAASLALALRPAARAGADEGTPPPDDGLPAQDERLNQVLQLLQTTG